MTVVSALQVTPTRLPEVMVVQPRVFADERGFFVETWSERMFSEAVSKSCRFVQDNHSRSAHGVLRGLHYQIEQPQGKLVRVTSGRVFDVAVDMRRSSPRLGQWVGVELRADDHRQVWIPPGFAHGFLVLSDSADVLYKTTEYYAPAHERAVRWNDSHLGIEWPFSELRLPPALSPKDVLARGWGECELFD